MRNSTPLDIVTCIPSLLVENFILTGLRIKFKMILIGNFLRKVEYVQSLIHDANPSQLGEAQWCISVQYYWLICQQKPIN